MDVSLIGDPQLAVDAVRTLGRFSRQRCGVRLDPLDEPRSTRLPPHCSASTASSRRATRPVDGWARRPRSSCSSSCSRKSSCPSGPRRDRPAGSAVGDDQVAVRGVRVLAVGRGQGPPAEVGPGLVEPTHLRPPAVHPHAAFGGSSVPNRKGEPFAAITARKPASRGEVRSERPMTSASNQLPATASSLSVLSGVR